MRILMVNDVGALHGGAEVVIDMLMQGLRGQGHEVRLLAGSQPSNGKTIADSRFANFADDSPWQLPLYVCNPFAAWALWRELRTYKPDVVHVHNATKASPLLFWLLRRRHTVLTLHDHVLLDPTQLKRIPALQPYEHTLDGYFISKPSPRYYMEKLRFWLYRKPFKALDRVVVCSKFFQTCAQQSGQFGKLVRVPNGIPLPAPQPKADTNRLLFVGRLEKVKGVDIVLQSLPAVVDRFPDMYLDIVGHGSQAQALKQQAKDLGIQNNVQFHGHLPREKVTQMYHASTAVLVPSRYPENFGLVVIEGLCVGPVIAGKVGGIPELIQQGKTGYVVAPDDAAGWSKAMIEVLDKSPVQRQQMAQAARQFVADNFTDKLMIERMIAVYGQVLSELA